MLPGDDGVRRGRARPGTSTPSTGPHSWCWPRTLPTSATRSRSRRTAGLGVGVLATGHGTGTPCDGGLLINTSRMRGVRVDPAARVARVEAGAVWEDVVEAAAAHGLAGLPGSSTTVGVVGYTLGGGFGWLGRRYGLAAHSITRAEVVTADGEFVTASPDEHPDLFWGLQGGTGNLGIVTAWSSALHPVRQVYGGNLYYPLERASGRARVLRRVEPVGAAGADRGGRPSGPSRRCRPSPSRCGAGRWSRCAAASAVTRPTARR